MTVEAREVRGCVVILQFDLPQKLLLTLFMFNRQYHNMNLEEHPGNLTPDPQESTYVSPKAILLAITDIDDPGHLEVRNTKRNKLTFSMITGTPCQKF